MSSKLDEFDVTVVATETGEPAEATVAWDRLREARSWASWAALLGCELVTGYMATTGWNKTQHLVFLLSLCVFVFRICHILYFQFCLK